MRALIVCVSLMLAGCVDDRQYPDLEGEVLCDTQGRAFTAHRKPAGTHNLRRSPNLDANVCGSNPQGDHAHGPA